MKTISIIGCGNVGKTLACLWNRGKIFSVSQILNRSIQSAEAAVQFIGAGSAAESFSDLVPADIILIGASDDQIASCCHDLVAANIIRDNTVVFHCSGSISSDILRPAQDAGARILSVHPLKSFANPRVSVETFQGTYCGIEGDICDDDPVVNAFAAIGAHMFSINSSQKTIYHAATVFACNYLTALLDVSLQCYEKSGIERKAAIEMLQPIINGTVKNIFNMGPANALTGPIARGDYQVVQRQYAALHEWDPQIAGLYNILGKFALKLSQEQGTASEESLQIMRELFDESSAST